jgi:hypothetical protein
MTAVSVWLRSPPFRFVPPHPQFRPDFPAESARTPNYRIVGPAGTPCPAESKSLRRRETLAAASPSRLPVKLGRRTFVILPLQPPGCGEQFQTHWLNYLSGFFSR